MMIAQAVAILTILSFVVGGWWWVDARYAKAEQVQQFAIQQMGTDLAQEAALNEMYLEMLRDKYRFAMDIDDIPMQQELMSRIERIERRQEYLQQQQTEIELMEKGIQ